MATSDKRELVLTVKADDKASRPLKNIGDAADDTKDELSQLNAGLKKLDDAMTEAAGAGAKLREEIARTGDLELVKDLAKQEQRLKAFARQRRLLVGDDEQLKAKPAMKLDLPDFPEAGIKDVATKVAHQLGAGIVSTLPRALTAGGGIGAAVVVPAVAGIATVLGAAGTGAVLGGAAAGAVGAGIKLAAKDPRVQAAGSELAASLGSQLEDAAAPFVPATLKAVGTVRATFRRLDDDLEDIFGNAASYVDPFARGVLGLVEKATPGLRRLVQAAGPVVDMLGRELPELGEDIGDALGMLADHAPEAARALGLVLDTTGFALKEVSRSITIAATGFKYLDLALAAARGPAELSETAAKYAVAADEADRETTDWSAALAGLGDKATGAATAVESLSEAQHRIVEGNLSLAEANLRVAEAVDAAKDAFDGKRGANREEQRALFDIVNELNAATTAFDKQGFSAIQAAEHTEVTRRTFIDAAVAAGHTRKEAERLAAQYLKLPKGVKTVVETETSAAKAALSSVKKTLDALDGRVANASVYISAYNKNAMPFSEGGPVVGAGTKGIDSVPAVLAPGEYVLNTRDVARLGGTAAIDDWRQGMTAASRPAAATGGGYGGSGKLDITIRWPDGTVAAQIVSSAFRGPADRQALNGLLGAIRSAGGNPAPLGI